MRQPHTTHGHLPSRLRHYAGNLGFTERSQTLFLFMKDCNPIMTWTGTTQPLLSKSVAGEILKDREVGTNPPADRIANIVMLFARGN
jgi:hypothetical protein